MDELCSLDNIEGRANSCPHNEVLAIEGRFFQNARWQSETTQSVSLSVEDGLTCNQEDQADGSRIVVFTFSIIHRCR